MLSLRSTLTSAPQAAFRPRWSSLGLDLVTLRIFMAAAQEHSLVAAGIRENLSASAVSRRISEFEARIGVVLFDRHDRGVTLTDAGKRLGRQLEDLFDLLEQIALDFDTTKSGGRGFVRLNAHMSATAGPLPKKLASFRLLHPDIHVQVSEQTSVEVAHSVSVGMADLGMISGTIPAGDLHVVPWHEDELVVVLPLNHRLLEHERVRFEELIDEPFIGLQKDSALLALYRHHMQALGRRLDERAHTTSFDSVRRLVSAGLGVSILPALASREGEVAESIATRPLDESWARRPLMICLRSLDKASMATRLLIDYLKDQA